MAERGGLGLLEVGVARDRGLGMPLRQVGQQGGESGEIVAPPLGGISQVQTQIEGHLVVARTPSVKLLAGVSDQFDEAALNCGMDVLIGVKEYKGPGAGLRENGVSPWLIEPYSLSSSKPTFLSMATWASDPSTSISSKRRSVWSTVKLQRASEGGSRNLPLQRFDDALAGRDRNRPGSLPLPEAFLSQAAQSEGVEPDEPGSIRLVVDLVLFKRGRRLVVEVVLLGSPAFHGHRSLVEAHPGLAVDPLLDLVHECLQGPPLRGEPEAVVDHLGVPRHQLVSKMGDLAIKCDRFDRPVGMVKQGPSRRFVDPPRFHANEAVFDDVYPPHHAGRRAGWLRSTGSPAPVPHR